MGGLVPAGEGPAGVGGLKLGRRQETRFAIGIGVFAAIEPVQFVVQIAGERYFQAGVSGGDRLGEGQGSGLPGTVQDNVGSSGRPAVAVQYSRVNLQVRCVQDNLSGGVNHLDVHGLFALECEVAKVGLKSQLVLLGTYRGWEHDCLGRGHVLFPPFKM